MEINRYFVLIDKLITTNRLHKKAIELYVEQLGIHRSLHRVLMHLSKNSFKSQKEIADHLGITPAAVTAVMKKLEGEGLVERKTGTDSRFNEINITEKGRQVVENTKVSFAAIDEAAFYGFSEKELDDFSRFLDRIQNNISNTVRKD